MNQSSRQTTHTTSYTHTLVVSRHNQPLNVTIKSDEIPESPLTQCIDYRYDENINIGLNHYDEYSAMHALQLGYS